MRVLIVTGLLLISAIVHAGPTFFRAHDADSVILGPVCVPEDEGIIDYAALDFNTASLTITIYASGDGVDTSYVYTGANIDDYDGTPPAWGNPAASAIEVEADDDCVRLHIRDEVFAVTNATEWLIKLSDGGTLIMDWEVQVLALATSADAQADVTAALEADGLDHLVAAAVVGADVTDNSIIAKIASKSATSDWDTFDNTADSFEAIADRDVSIKSTVESTNSDTGSILLDTGTNGVVLAADAIDATKIAADSIGASEIGSAAIDADAIAPDAIGASEIGTAAIDADAIASDAIGAAEIGTAAIGADEIATNSIGAQEISDGAIDAGAIADNAIDAATYSAGAIDAAAVAANAIGASEIAADAIGSSELASTAVDEIWDEIIETAGSTYTARCASAIQLSYAAGTWSTSGAVSTFKDPSGASNRIVGTITATTRDTITISCP
jgi:hypothetical protein